MSIENGLFQKGLELTERLNDALNRLATAVEQSALAQSQLVDATSAVGLQLINMESKLGLIKTELEKSVEKMPDKAAADPVAGLDAHDYSKDTVVVDV